ncbi:hypothetical protein LCGC14_3046300, partial [marine sediment metagenome]
KSIGDLKSLQVLNLEENQLTTLPELIGNLKSLRELDLNNNMLITLPRSMWQLKNLENISLDGNNWEGEWKEVAESEIPAIRKYCRKRGSE